MAVVPEGIFYVFKNLVCIFLEKYINIAYTG
jgi:hypothetical protein